MKIITKTMIIKIIKQRYGDVKFEYGVYKLQQEQLVTVLNKNSSNKRYSVCETLL